MENDKLSKIEARQPQEVCAHFELELEESAQALLRDGMSSTEYLQTLVDEGLYPDAIQFLAYALPKREAVWWACMCARTSLSKESQEQTVLAQKGAEDWVYNPDDEHLQAAKSAAEATELDSPSSLAAMAAVFSGPSLAPPDMDPVPPPDNLTGTMVFNSAILAATIPDPAKQEEQFLDFLLKGMEIARGPKQG